MSFAIIAVIISALLHPLVGVFAKKAAHPLTINFWGIVFASVFFSYVYFDISYWERILNHWDLILLAGILHSIYAILSLTLITKHEFQVLYPLTRLSPIFILIGEVVILGSEIFWFQILGIILITTGALIFGLDKKINGIRLQVLFQIFIIALTVACFFMIDKKILEFLNPSEQWATVFIQIPILSLLVLNRKKELITDLKNFKNLIAYTLSMIGTWYAALYALQTLDSSVVASIRNLSILFGVFLGAHIFSEGHKALRYLAAISIIGGVFLILWDKI